MRTPSIVRSSSPSHRKINKMVFPFLLALFAMVMSAAASAQVVASADFEDGTDGFFAFGNAHVATSTDVAYSKSQSLLTTNRTQSYEGPATDLSKVLVPGQTYSIKVAVRLSGSTPGSDSIAMNFAIAPSYPLVASGTVTEKGWTVLQGTYTAPSSGGSSLVLYIQDTTNPSASFYIDAFTVTGSAAVSSGCTNPPDNSGFVSNFDDGTTQGWFGRGAAGVSLTNDSHSGAASLLVQGRTMFWNGAAKDITGKMCNGQQYWVEAWVKMAPGQPATSLNLSLQYTDSVTNQTRFPGVATSASKVTDSQWVRLKSKPYTFSGNYSDLQIYVQSTPSDTTYPSFEIDDVKVVYLPPPTIENIPPISQAYAGDFPVGFAAVDSDILGVHGQLAALHYNSVTPGNDLKWDATEPSEGNFNFGPADAIVSWAQAHNIRVRGHNFVWHNQVPNWVWIDPATGKDMSTEPYSDTNKAVLLGRLKNHINALINHYYGPGSTFGNTIYVWDVVNEAIDDGNPANFRKSKWYQITVDPSAPAGPPEYMDDAFIYARAALDNLGYTRDKVELCYNDYNTTIAAKGQFIYNWVKGAISRGVPIDCVGNQFHNTINFPIDDAGSAGSKQSVINTLNMFNSLTATSGKPIQNEITEFDISLYRYGNCNQTFYTDYDDLLAGDQIDLINEGYRYRDYFQIFKNMKDKIDSVTIWGLADDTSWLNPNSNAAGCGKSANDAPLPFDSYLQHKYAYTGLVNPQALPPIANLVTTITPNATTVLSGSALTYTIAVTNSGPSDAASLTLTTAVPSSTAFQSIAAPNGWSCTTPAVGGNGAVTCTGSALANGSSAQFTLNTLVVCATPDGTPIANTATVTSTTLNPNPNPQNSASVTVQVSNPPPVISGLSVTPNVLWPPNHKMVNAALSYSITDNCDTNIVPTISITSNQGSSSDWLVVDAHDVQVRAERLGTGTDRIYTITLTATDSAGSSSSASTTVTVPHDQGN